MEKASVICRSISLGLLILTLLAAPLPLGGALFWAPAMQQMLIALAFLIWGVSGVLVRSNLGTRLRPAAFPALCMVLVILWALVQSLPVVPQSWVHPLWPMTAELTGQPLRGTVSLNPWWTRAEALKLLSYLCAGLMSYDFARRDRTAALLLLAVIFTVTLDAIIGFALYMAEISPRNLFFATQQVPSFVTGLFVLHNSFATFCGLGALAAMARIILRGGETIVFHRGWRPFFYTLLHFVFGHGAGGLIAFFLCFGGVVASASRAGFVATCAGMLIFCLLYLFVSRHSRARHISALAAFVIILPVFFLMVGNGDALAARMQDLVDADLTDNTRLALWDAAWRMVQDAPWYGLGLGSFQDAYALYATLVIPNVHNRAHCDYLEFIAGVGIPAAFLWFSALLYMALAFLRGLRVRRRGTAYPVLGFAALTLVGVHSAVDFSLQLPPVALIFAVLLGVCGAQSLRTQERAGLSPELTHEPRRLYERG